MAHNRTSRDKNRALKNLSNVSESEGSIGRKKPYSRRQKTYCICEGPSEGLMIECESCREWFHAACLHLEEKDIPPQFTCSTCVSESKEARDLEETIIEALSLLAEQAASQMRVNHRQDLSSSDRDDYDESMQDEIPSLTSDDKENIPNSAKFEDTAHYAKKRFVPPAHVDIPIQREESFSSLNMPSSPISDHHFASDDLSPLIADSLDPPSPSSPGFPSSPSGRRNQPHAVTKTYTRKSKKQILILEKYYEDNQSPDANMIHLIAQESNLPEQKVSRWFYDKRRRSKQLTQANR